MHHMSSITALCHLSEYHKNTSQKIISESQERYNKEELRQMQVMETVRDFSKCGKGLTRRVCVSGVNSISRTALVNRLEKNALDMEAWALHQETKLTLRRIK